jgi:hypothetical protein
MQDFSGSRTIRSTGPRYSSSSAGRRSIAGPARPGKETGRRPCGQRPVGDSIPAALAAGFAAEPASASHSPAAATHLPWRAETQD